MRRRLFKQILDWSCLGLIFGFILFAGLRGGHVEAVQPIVESALPGACQESRYTRYHPGIDRSRPLIVLLHGLTNCPWEMNDLATAFFDAGYDVVVPRLPGHGTTSADLESLNYEDVVAFEGRLVAETFARSDRVFWVGASYGGLIAAHAAQTYPGYIRGIGLLSPFLASAYDSVLTVACAAHASPGAFALLPGGAAGLVVLDQTRFISNGASAPSSDPARRFWYMENPVRTVCLGARISGMVQAGLPRSSLPTLLLTSDADEVVNAPAVRSMYAAATSVTQLWYQATEGVRHQVAPRNLHINPRWDGMRDELLRFVEANR